jgi:hypothetical protein
VAGFDERIQHGVFGSQQGIIVAALCAGEIGSVVANERRAITRPTACSPVSILRAMSHTR